MLKRSQKGHKVGEKVTKLVKRSQKGHKIAKKVTKRS